MKKGTAKVNTESVTLSADNKTAVIELSGKMTEGTYTVNVTSGEAKLDGSVTVTNEKVETVEILSENAVLDSKGENVSVGYQVKNQYGEDITKTTTLIANAAGSTVTGTPTISQSKGIVTMTTVKDKVKEGDTLTLTLVHGDTGKAATKVLKVSAKSQVAEITLGSLYNKDGKTLSETTDLTKDKFYVLVDAVDQYGQAVEADKLITSGEGQNVVLSETNPLVADVQDTFETITVDGKEKVALQLNSASKLVVGETTVMAIATSTGKNSSLKITVAEGQRADTAVINTPELVVAGEKTFLPIEVTDKEGKVITDVKVLKDAKRGVTLSGGSVTQEDWTTKDGKTGVYLDLTKETASSYKSIVAVTSSNKTAIANVQVKEAAKPVRIDGVTKAVSTTLLSSKTTKLELAGLKIIDQYERELTTDQKTALFATDYKLVVTEEDGNDVVTFADGTVTAHDSKTGTEKVTVSIQKKDGSDYKDVTGSEKTITFRVTDGTEYISYEVDKIGNIFDEVGAGLKDTEGTNNEYTKEIKVYGVLDNGQKVELTAGKDFTVDAPTWLTVDGEDGKLNPKSENTDSKVPYATTDAKEVKTNVTVTINATGDTFKEEVTVSKVKPTVTSVKVVAEDTVTKDEVYSEDKATEFEELKEVSAVDFTSAKSIAEHVDFAVVDSYGVKRVLDNATIAGEYLPAIKLLVKPNVANTVTIEKNNSAEATISAWKADGFVTVTASVDGLEKLFQINGKKDATSGDGGQGGSTVQNPAPELTGVSFADVEGSGNDNKTKITLPAVSALGNTFKYLISTDNNKVPTPELGQDLSSWTDVTDQAVIDNAPNGKNIGIAEVDSNGKAVKFFNGTSVSIDHVPATAGKVTATNAPSLDTAVTTGALVVKVNGNEAENTFTLSLDGKLANEYSDVNKLATAIAAAENNSSQALSTVADVTVSDGKIVITSKSTGTSSSVTVTVTGTNADTLTGFAGDETNTGLAASN